MREVKGTLHRYLNRAFFDHYKPLCKKLGTYGLCILLALTLTFYRCTIISQRGLLKES